MSYAKQRRKTYHVRALSENETIGFALVEYQGCQQGWMQDFDHGGNYRIVIAYRVQIH
jgi:hypothetical protein